MTNHLPAPRRIVTAVATAALLATVASNPARADNNGAITGLRPISAPSYSQSGSDGTGTGTGSGTGTGTGTGLAPPTNSSGWPTLPANQQSGTGATSTNGWSTNAGCDTSYVYPSLANAGNYSYGQTYANDAAVVKQPQSYSSCLTTLLQEANTINDMFSNGFSVGISIQSFADIAVKNIISGIESQVCKAVQSAANGVFGGFKTDFSLLNGEAVISLDASATPTPVTLPVTTPTPPYSPPPVSTSPTAPVVLPPTPTPPAPKKGR